MYFFVNLYKIDSMCQILKVKKTIIKYQKLLKIVAKRKTTHFKNDLLFD